MGVNFEFLPSTVTLCLTTHWILLCVITLPLLCSNIYKTVEVTMKTLFKIYTFLPQKHSDPPFERLHNIPFLEEKSYYE